MKRAALAAIGYLASLLIAAGAVALHSALTASDSQGADGMFAFGDLLLFLAVFGLLALLNTFAALLWRSPR